MKTFAMLVTERAPWKRRVVRWFAVMTALALASAPLAGTSKSFAESSTAAAVSRPGPGTPSDPFGQQLSVQLGKNWWRGTDLIVTSTSDKKGMHYFVARESEGYFWRPLASILPGGSDAGAWTGYFCVSGDGRYVLATVAPTLASNHPDLEDRGALAYVIDIASGRVRPLVAGVAMYYDVPGCGVGDTGVLSSFPGTGETQTVLLTADLANARLIRRQLLHGQFTSAVPSGGGIAAYSGDAVVSVGTDGRVRRLAAVTGAAYDLVPSSGSGLEYLTTTFGSTAHAWHFSAGKVTQVGTGSRTGLHLFAGASGHNEMTGAAQDTKMRAAAVTAGMGSLAVSTSSAPASVSRRGLVTEILQVQGTGQARLQPTPVLVSTVTGQRLQRPLPAPASASTAMPPPIDSKSPAAHTGGAIPAANTTTPVCAVPRLNPQRQVLQPNHQQVEWAADLAAQGKLSVQRPANYDNMGLPAYSPGTDLPAPALVGGGSIPPQVVLGILAQESNFWQASWHALPGIAGDPLIADYYGDGGGINVIDYSLADCGYGIGQITTGMNVGSTYWGTSATQAKIAVDYTENIAAAVSLLSQKWNQLHSYATPILANGGNSSYVENWYMALWAYNTGLNPSAATGNTTGCTPGPNCTDAAGNGPGGNWGLGWTNNPENTSWNPSREPFLLSNYADAAHPGDWPYQEKVLGWARVPLLDYTGTPSYVPTTGYPSVAPFPTFCTTNDSCSTANVNHCTLANYHCWWHWPVSWISCSTSGACHPGIYSYAAGSSEPPVSSPHPPDCNSTLPSSTYIVDEEPVNYNIVGCGSVNWKSQGSFALTQGVNSAGVPISLIDTHQLGAGFGGHLFFTHNYAATDTEHLVTGTWKISLPTQAYHVLVHIPSTGGITTSAHYKVLTSNGTTYDEVVDQYQQQDEWVGIGYFGLGSNAAVTLKNVTDDSTLGDHDVAFDAVAFVPVPGQAVNHTFDAVSLFDWNQNLNTNMSSTVNTPARTMQTLHDWAVDYGDAGPMWNAPSTYHYGVSSYPACSSLSAITSACVPADVWNVGYTWTAYAQLAGTAPASSSSPVMTEPTWLGLNNPTPGPTTMTSSTYSDDGSYKIKTHIDTSFVVSNGIIVPGSEQVNTSVRTGDTHLPAFVSGFMNAVQQDYGIAAPNLSYNEVDANTYSGDATPVNPLAAGETPGRQYVWHADPGVVTSNGTCLQARAVTGGTVGWRPLAAQTPVAASVSAWVTALQNDAKVNQSVVDMAGEINNFFFSQSLMGGTLFLHAAPIWEDAHLEFCVNGTIASTALQNNIEMTPQRTLVDESFMPDLYLYYDRNLVDNYGNPTTGRVEAGDYQDFTNLPSDTDVAFNAYGGCDTGTRGAAGNPWGLTATAAPDAQPATGFMCDNQYETFGSPYQGG